MSDGMGNAKCNLIQLHTKKGRQPFLLFGMHWAFAINTRILTDEGS